MNNAIDCAYTIEGNGPALFLIHGIGAARDAWRYVCPSLTDRFTVITYDLRGHGVSPLPEKEFGLDDLVADLELLRQRTVIDKAHFAGHSLGGMIGPAYARAHPDRVLSLGLLSTAAFRAEVRACAKPSQSRTSSVGAKSIADPVGKPPTSLTRDSRRTHKGA